MPTMESPRHPGMALVTPAGESLTLTHDPRAVPTTNSTHEAQLQDPSGALTTHAATWNGSLLSATIPGASLGTGGAHFVRFREVGSAWPTEAISVFVTGGTQPGPGAHSHPQADVTGLVTDIALRELAANKGIPAGYAGLNVGGLVPTAQLGLGVANSSTFLRGDQTYAVPATAGGSGPVVAASLATDAPANLTTTGVMVAGLSLPVGPGTYAFTYNLVYRSAATTTGAKFGVNHTGTTTLFVATARLSTTGTAAVTAVHDQVTTTTPTIMGTVATRTKSTTAPNLGPWTDVDTANADMYLAIEGLLIVTVAGSLDLWHASEVAASSTVKAGSSLILTKTSA